MKKQIVWSALAGLSLTLVPALAQDSNDASTKSNTNASTQARKPSVDFKAQDQQLAPYMCPNENHKVLEQFTGQWDAAVTVYESGAPQKFTGTQVNTLGLGGRFLNTSFNGNFNGMAFLGSGTMGFNNISKEYEATWIDSMSTWISFETNGKYDSSSRTLTLKGRYTDPETRQERQTRSVYVVNSTSQYTCTTYETVNGKESKAMEIVYTRKALASNNGRSINNNPRNKASNTQDTKQSQAGSPKSE